MIASCIPHSKKVFSGDLESVALKNCSGDKSPANYVTSSSGGGGGVIENIYRQASNSPRILR